MAKARYTAAKRAVPPDSSPQEVAERLREQAQEIDNPKLKAVAEREAKRIEEDERAAKIAAARNAPFSRVALWMQYLDLTQRERITLGRIYSFQCSTGKDGAPMEYRISLSRGAEELGMYDRAELKGVLNRLVGLGFVVKRSNGDRKPPTYLVDEVACIDKARENGYLG